MHHEPADPHVDLQAARPVGEHEAAAELGVAAVLHRPSRPSAAE